MVALILGFSIYVHKNKLDDTLCCKSILNKKEKPMHVYPVDVQCVRHCQPSGSEYEDRRRNGNGSEGLRDRRLLFVCERPIFRIFFNLRGAYTHKSISHGNHGNR